MPSLVPLFHMEYPQDEPYFNDPSAAACIISKAINQSCRSDVRKGKSLYLSQYGVVTKSVHQKQVLLMVKDFMCW